MPLTPEEFNQLAHKEDIQRLESKIDHLADAFTQMLTIMDNSAKKSKDIEVELVSNQAAHDRFETRITALEKADL